VIGADRMSRHPVMRRKDPSKNRPMLGSSNTVLGGVPAVAWARFDEAVCLSVRAGV
jgi:hypothetical protein